MPSGAVQSRERAPVFEAIADPTRRNILERLAAADLPAGDIAAAFPISRPAVSKHLRVLRQAALVCEERHGRRRVYRLNARPLHEVDRWLEHYRAFWEKSLESLKLHVEASLDTESGDHAKRSHRG
jgi:DNA-binding transcriptional ArsR family regulator